MDVKFTVVPKNLLGDVQKSDGQIIAIYDEAGLYYEMGGQRYSVLGMQFETVIQKPTTSSIPDANGHTFYFYNSTSPDGGLYVFDEANSLFIKISYPNSEINVYKVTIPNSGWTSTANGYTRDVTTSSTMTANSTIIAVLPAANSTTAQKEAFEQWDAIETKAGKITISSSTQITTSFGIVMIETPEAN